MVIEMSDEVDYLVKRLRELKAQDILEIDMDYLNAVYVNLPEYEQVAWDKVDLDDYDSEWEVFMVFMSEITTAALKKCTRVESLREMKKEKELSHKGDKLNKHKKDCNIDVLATNVEPVNSRSDD